MSLGAQPAQADAAKRSKEGDGRRPASSTNTTASGRAASRGEVRILGLPSMRELMRIPVFNRCSATGWGLTNESLKILTEGLTPETKDFLAAIGQKTYLNGDLHHPRPSFTDGAYDGRYLFVNDKANTRLARIRCDVMKCDKIIQVPNAHPIHGLRLQRYPRTGYVFCNGENRAPVPNDGKLLDDPKKWRSVFTAVDGDTMTVAWQVIVSGNLDNNDADYKGKYCRLDLLQRRGGHHGRRDDGRPTRTTSSSSTSRRIEKAVKDGKYEEINGVKVLDGRKTSKLDITLYIPVANSPHGCNAAPDGKHLVINGKLSPTVTIFDVGQVRRRVRRQDQAGDDAIVGNLELGLGPLHTTFDGRATLHLAVPRQPGREVEHRRGDPRLQGREGQPDQAEDRRPLSDRPHQRHAWARPRKPTASGLVALCKFSKDRFLNVGPLKPENDQLIDISGDKMVLVHDGPTFAEPHDATIMHASKLNPLEVWKRDDPYLRVRAAAGRRRTASSSRTDNKVDPRRQQGAGLHDVVGAGLRPEQFTVKKGDEVTVFVTNIDDVVDLTHGFTIVNYGIAMEVAPQATASVTFTADKPGVHYYYCQWFCHALHMEM